VACKPQVTSNRLSQEAPLQLASQSNSDAWARITNRTGG